MKSELLHELDYFTACGPGNYIGSFINTMNVLDDEKRFMLLTEHFLLSEDYPFPTTTSYRKS